jgi:phenylalanine-4-hydroxylase
MEFTPEPDMFHDIFGHLPYLTLPFYAAIEDKFAPAYRYATTAEREAIKSLAWYSTEFGLVMENNRLKVFGAGIISGRAEFANTVMEFYRLIRDGLIDYRGDVYQQLCQHFDQHQEQIEHLIQGIQRLHQQGEMSSAENGWNVIQRLYAELGIPKRGYLGGDVILAPFDVNFITMTPKTVYAFNPIFYTAASFTELDRLLDSYLKPIALRHAVELRSA